MPRTRSLPPWPVWIWAGLVVALVLLAYERSGRAGLRTIPLLLLVLLVVRGSPIGWGIAVVVNGLLGLFFVAIAFRSEFDTDRVLLAAIGLVALLALVTRPTRHWVGLSSPVSAGGRTASGP